MLGTSGVKHIRNKYIAIAMISLCLLAVLISLFYIDDPYSWYLRGGSYVGANLSISDSGRVVYSSPRSGRGDIYSFTLANTTPVKLIGSKYYEGDACISPDGGKIVFGKITAANSSFLLYDVRTKSSKTIYVGDCRDPMFSSDSKKILYYVFIHTFNKRETVLHLYDCVAAVDRKLPFSRSDITANLDASSNYVLYQERLHIERFHVVNIPQNIPVSNGMFAEVSPDNSNIAFVTGIKDTFGSVLYISKIDGTKPRVICRYNAEISYWHYTSDGKSIIFSAEDARRNDIVLCDIQTGATRVIGSIIP